MEAADHSTNWSLQHFARTFVGLFGTWFKTEAFFSSGISMFTIMRVSAKIFYDYALAIMNKAPGLSPVTFDSKHKSLFGISSHMCVTIWESIMDTIPEKTRPVHLLWSLLFLKIYATENVNSILSGADPKTFRNKVKIVLHHLSKMNVIHWKLREMERPFLQRNVHSSVDGVDFKIYEPKPFSPIWYSHKFNGPALRYEVALSTRNGMIIWGHGPFPAGKFSDLKIFKLKLSHLLKANEKIIGDGTYKNPKCVQRHHFRTTRGRQTYEKIRARQETLFRRLRHFFILSHVFRHRLDLHATCFFSVLNITQLVLHLDQPLFKVS